MISTKHLIFLALLCAILGIFMPFRIRFLLSVLQVILKVSDLLNHFAPQPVIGPFLPDLAPAAWNCNLIFRSGTTIFEVQCCKRKAMSSNRIVLGNGMDFTWWILYTELKKYRALMKQIKMNVVLDTGWLDTKMNNIDNN